MALRDENFFHVNPMAVGNPDENFLLMMMNEDEDSWVLSNDAALPFLISAIGEDEMPPPFSTQDEFPDDSFVEFLLRRAVADDEDAQQSESESESEVVYGTSENRNFNSSSDKVHECAICMEEFAEQVQITAFSCCHIFHQDCISGWFQLHRTCPLCRWYYLVDKTVLPTLGVAFTHFIHQWI